jgi:lipopolysaccharide export system ATP-binding protein
VRNLWAFFRRRRPPQSRRGPDDYDWSIELVSLGGVIPDIRAESMNLSPARPPRRRAPAPRQPPRAEPQQPRPEPQLLRQEPPTLRSEPQPLRQELAAQWAETQAMRPERPPRPEPPAMQPEPKPVRDPWPRPQAAKPQPARSRAPQAPRAQAIRPDQPAAHSDSLAAQGLCKAFAGRKVVNNVSIHVRRGEAVGLLGPNGAGKTTVFYMITGLIKADRGRIDLDGQDVTRLPMYQRARLGVGYLPQEASIFRGLNVEENIRSVLEVTEPNRRRREADLTALLDEFGITRLRKTPSIALSGGERRRVEIARALASRPSYMLLDEPFAGIDPKAVVEIQKLVRHLTHRGIGVLITDHNVRETLDLTDRSYIIYSGEVLMEGDKEEIVNDPEVRRLYLGEDFRFS